MSKEDIFSKLSDEWMTQAAEADKWKGRFACCNELWDIVEPLADGIGIKGGKKTEKGIKYLITWLDVEKHLFTRIKILQIFTKILSGLDASVMEKLHSKLASGLVKQWMEKKANPYVTPLLIINWNKFGEVGRWTEAITYVLQSTNPIVKGAWWAFLGDIGELNPRKAKEEFEKKLLKNGEQLESAIADTDNRNNDTKKAAFRFLCVCSIFVAKSKEKKFIKKINALCDSDDKKKAAIEEHKQSIRETMKANAKKNAPKKKAPAGGDDEKGGDNLKAGKGKRGRSKSPGPKKGGATGGGGKGGGAPVQLMVSGASKEELEEVKNKIDALNDDIQMLKMQFGAMKKFQDHQKETREKCRLVVGCGASIHDLFENFLLNTIGMPHYLQRFKAAGANDIRMVEHFDVPFLKETIGVQNKLEGKLLVKFVGKFNEETMAFRAWLTKQNVMTAYVNIFESKGIITWNILSDYCPTIEAVQKAFRINNKQHAHFLFTQLEKYRNGELSDYEDADAGSSEESSDDESDDSE